MNVQRDCGADAGRPGVGDGFRKQGRCLDTCPACHHKRCSIQAELPDFYSDEVLQDNECPPLGRRINHIAPQFCVCKLPINLAFWGRKRDVISFTDFPRLTLASPRTQSPFCLCSLGRGVIVSAVGNLNKGLLIFYFVVSAFTKLHCYCCADLFSGFAEMSMLCGFAGATNKALRLLMIHQPATAEINYSRRCS